MPHPVYLNPLDDLPTVPTPIVEWLEQQFPDRCPKAEDDATLADLHRLQGALAVVGTLRRLHDAQRRSDSR